MNTKHFRRIFHNSWKPTTNVSGLYKSALSPLRVEEHPPTIEDVFLPSLHSNTFSINNYFLLVHANKGINYKERNLVYSEVVLLDM